MAASRSRVGLPESVQVRYRALADSAARKLKDLHADAVASFVEARLSAPSSQDPFPYLVAPRNSVNQNVDLPPELWVKVHTLAERDEVATRRILYTALVRFLDQANPATRT